jgi:hypothetical protein
MQNIFHICRKHVAVLEKNATHLRAPIHVLLLPLGDIFIVASEWLLVTFLLYSRKLVVNVVFEGGL